MQRSDVGSVLGGVINPVLYQCINGIGSDIGTVFAGIINCDVIPVVRTRVVSFHIVYDSCGRVTGRPSLGLGKESLEKAAHLVFLVLFIEKFAVGNDYGLRCAWSHDSYRACTVRVHGRDSKLRVYGDILGRQVVWNQKAPHYLFAVEVR